MSFADKIAKTKQVLPKGHGKVVDTLPQQELADYKKQGTPDAEALSELKVALAQTQLQLKRTQVARERAHNEGIKQDQALRDKYAAKAYKFVGAWSIVLAILLVLDGIEIPGSVGFNLSENILLALIGGVTVNVLAVFLSVMNYLFPQKLQRNTSKRGTRQVKPR